SIAHLDVSAITIGLVVETADRTAELGDDLLPQLFGMIGSGQDEEIVATDVAEEIAGAAVVGGRLDHDLGEARDRLIARGVAVVIVEGLEEIDVDLEHRERLIEREPAVDLLVDRQIARQPGQRARGPLLPAPLEHVADAELELASLPGLGDVVV